MGPLQGDGRVGEIGSDLRSDGPPQLEARCLHQRAAGDRADEARADALVADQQDRLARGTDDRSDDRGIRQISDRVVHPLRTTLPDQFAGAAFTRLLVGREDECLVGAGLQDHPMPVGAEIGTGFQCGHVNLIDPMEWRPGSAGVAGERTERGSARGGRSTSTRPPPIP